MFSLDQKPHLVVHVIFEDPSNIQSYSNAENSDTNSMLAPKVVAARVVTLLIQEGKMGYRRLGELLRKYNVDHNQRLSSINRGEQMSKSRVSVASVLTSLGIPSRKVVERIRLLGESKRESERKVQAIGSDRSGISLSTGHLVEQCRKEVSIHSSSGEG